jgi:hypothetical protein
MLHHLGVEDLLLDLLVHGQLLDKPVEELSACLDAALRCLSISPMSFLTF